MWSTRCQFSPQYLARGPGRCLDSRHLVPTSLWIHTDSQIPGLVGMGSTTVVSTLAKSFKHTQDWILTSGTKSVPFRLQIERKSHGFPRASSCSFLGPPHQRQVNERPGSSQEALGFSAAPCSERAQKACISTCRPLGNGMAPVASFCNAPNSPIRQTLYPV